MDYHISLYFLQGKIQCRFVSGIQNHFENKPAEKGTNWKQIQLISLENIDGLPTQDLKRVMAKLRPISPLESFKKNLIACEKFSPNIGNYIIMAKGIKSNVRMFGPLISITRNSLLITTDALQYIVALIWSEPMFPSIGAHTRPRGHQVQLRLTGLPLSSPAFTEHMAYDSVIIK